MNPHFKRGPHAAVAAKLPRGGFALGLVVGLLIGLALALAVALFITKVPVPFVNKVPQRTAEQDSAEAERNRRWDPNAPLAAKPPVRAAAPASAAAGTSPANPASPTAATTPSLPNPSALPAPSSGANEPARGLPPVTAPTGRDPAAILAGGPVPGPASAAAAAAAVRRPPPAASVAGAAAGAVATNPGATPGSTAAPLPGAAPRVSTAAQVDAFVYFIQAGAYTRSEDADRQKARVAGLGFNAMVSEREQSGRVMYRVRVGPLRGREEAEAMQLRLQENGLETQIVRVER